MTDDKMVEIKETQRLYLEKGEEDIFVDTVILRQHQYDGIRFLFRQFRKGKAGAIINDPKGYGKRVQIALFISAMSPVMSLPILILCPEGKERLWIDRFKTWTNMGSDVSIQKSNEVAKSACVVSLFSHLNALSRREWSILVVDDNVVSRDLLNSKIDPKYKIWCTTLDMKKNLQTFSLIYKWFYPKDRFIVEDFQTSTKNPTTLLAKSARLDAFMEDIVIRRKCVLAPLWKTTCTLQPPAKATRKNKDATGKKIKRSKAKSIDEETCSESQEILIEPQVPVQLAKNGKIESIKDFAAATKNGAQAKIYLDPISGFTNKGNRANEIEKGQTNKSDSKITDNEEQKKTDVMEVDSDEFNYNEVEKSNLIMECDDLGDTYELLSRKDIESQNIIIKYDSPDIDNEFEDDNIPTEKPKSTKEINLKNNQIESDGLFSADALLSANKSDCKTKNVKIDLKNNKDHSVIFSDGWSSNGDKDEVDNDTNHKNDGNEINNDTKDELLKDNIVSENNKTEPKLEGIELKMKQMEELAMKKFKGSFLDNMI